MGGANMPPPGNNRVKNLLIFASLIFLVVKMRKQRVTASCQCGANCVRPLSTLRLILALLHVLSQLHLLHVCSFAIHPLVINHWQLQTNESCMKQKYLNGFRIQNLFLNLTFSELNCQFGVTLMTHLCLAGST